LEIINVMAASLDGKIASHPGERDKTRRELGFTNDDDRAHLLEMIKTADAVIVGRSSVEASGGAFPGRNGKGAFPIWVVLTNAGMRPDARVLQQADLPRWLVSRAPLPGLPLQPTLRNVVAGERAVTDVVVDELRAAGAERILLFGGAEVNGIFYKAGLVDQLVLTLCPIIIGHADAVPLVREVLPEPAKLALVSSQPKGNLVFLTYKLTKKAPR
jgi:5-amino-6-(5-phosphoribosylamino)uracil reductase